MGSEMCIRDRIEVGATLDRETHALRSFAEVSKTSKARLAAVSSPSLWANTGSVSALLSSAKRPAPFKSDHGKRIDLPKTHWLGENPDALILEFLAQLVIVQAARICVIPTTLLARTVCLSAIFHAPPCRSAMPFCQGAWVPEKLTSTP